MSVQLLTEHHLEFLSLKVGCTGSNESTQVKMPHCWKSHVTAHFCCILDEYLHSEATYIDAVSPEDFSHADTYAHSDQLDTTCCDDIPDLTEDISQAESLPFSEQGDLISEQCDDPGGSHKRNISPVSEQNSLGIKLPAETKSKLDKSGENSVNSDKANLENTSGSIAVENIAISELTSESESSEGLSVIQSTVSKPTELVTVTEMSVSEAIDNNQNVKASVHTEKDVKGSAVVNGDLTSKSDRKSSKERSNSRKESKKTSFSDKSKTKDKVSDITPDNSSMTTPSKMKRSRRKQVHYKPFITRCLGSIGMDHIISESCEFYKGIIGK